MAFTQAMIVGASGNTMNVNDANEGLVYNPTGIMRASLLGNAYSWPAVSANIDTTDCMILVANTSSSKNLVISYVMFQGDIVGNMNCKICSVAGLTLAGTAIVGVNLNPSAGGVAPASAFADETASPATSIIYAHAQSLPYAAVAGIMNRVNFDDAIILGQNYAFGIDTILEPAAKFEATVFGYFIDA